MWSFRLLDSQGTVLSFCFSVSSRSNSRTDSRQQKQQQTCVRASKEPNQPSSLSSQEKTKRAIGNKPRRHTLRRSVIVPAGANNKYPGGPGYPGHGFRGPRVVLVIIDMVASHYRYED